MICRLLALAAVLAAPASATAAVCEEREPETKAERLEARIRDGQGFRRDFGMPASRRHVLRVMRSPRRRLDFGLPLSPKEVRYLDRRGRITSSPGWERAEDYARRHASTFGGMSVGDDYPRGGAAVLRFTREIPRHRAALRRLAPFPVRVRRVDHSERRLRRVQDGIDHRALESRGITIQSIGVDIDRSRVEVEYISDRPDAARLIRARFGPLVVADRIARRSTRLVCVDVRAARVSGPTVVLEYYTNSEYVFERVFVVEEDQRVRVGIVERAPNGVVTLVGSARTAEVELAAPLGDRELVQATTGKPIRQR